MNINNKEFTDPYGNDGVDIAGYNPQITKDYLQQEHNSLGAPVDGSSPSLDPQPYYPDGGTILSDEYFNYSNSGIQEVGSYSVNTVAQDEARMRQIEKERQMGRSIYNAPPSVSGIPNIAEPPKPTQDQLAQQMKEANINSLTMKINSLQNELGVLQMKITRTEIGLKKAKKQLSELESN